MTVGAVAPIAMAAAVTPVGPISYPIAGAEATTGTAGGFGAEITKGLDHLQQVQATADDLSVQAATGRLTDVHDYMIAATEASLVTELTVAIRNKAVDAFNEIMRMQA
jgi:flagellar hook-basal body complex protein FliE